MNFFPFITLIIIFIYDVESLKTPPFLSNLMSTIKNAFIKRTIMDRSSEALGYRDIKHAAGEMKGRVHYVDKLIALQENFKSEVEQLSYTNTVSKDRIVEILAKQITNIEQFHRILDKIEKYMIIIESKYNELERMNINAKSHHYMKFVDDVVARKDDTVYDAITKLNSILSDAEPIHKELSENSFIILIKYLEMKKDISECKSITATIEILYTFLQSMIIIHLKGQMLITHGYLMKELSSENDKNVTVSYKEEVKNLDTLIINSIDNLIKIFMLGTKNLQSFSYNCRPVNGYQEHVNYERFTQFLNKFIANERYLAHPYKKRNFDVVRCTQNCPFFDLSFTSDPHFGYCSNGVMRNCKKFEEVKKICLKRDSSVLYSRDTSDCASRNVKDTTTINTPDFFKCDICHCICDSPTKHNFVYTGVVSAKAGDVVTGIRFNKTQNTIFLSILSGKPMPMGFVDVRNATWTTLPKNPNFNRDKFFRISWWCRMFVLSDVTLERYYVVTGVQFVINPHKCMINLKVYGTMINILDGKLLTNLTTTSIVKPCECISLNNINPYQTRKIKI